MMALRMPQPSEGSEERKEPYFWIILQVTSMTGGKVQHQQLGQLHMQQNRLPRFEISSASRGQRFDLGRRFDWVMSLEARMGNEEWANGGIFRHSVRSWSGWRAPPFHSSLDFLE